MLGRWSLLWPGKQVEDTDDQLGWRRVEAVETGTDGRHERFSERSKKKISQKPSCVGFVVGSAAALGDMARFILA